MNKEKDEEISKQNISSGLNSNPSLKATSKSNL
jgi:hypothetical protein